MADESRVQQLIDEILDSDRAPEEVCSDCPELLLEVRQRWQQMRLVEAELNAMFPTQGHDRNADTPAPEYWVGDLPRIYGAKNLRVIMPPQEFDMPGGPGIPPQPFVPGIQPELGPSPLGMMMPPAASPWFTTDQRQTS